MSAHFLIAAFLWSVVAVGVGVHAMDRGRSGFFWGILTIVTGVIGVIAYLVVLGNELDVPNRDENVVVCPNCSARYSESPNYCSDCGEPLEEGDETSTARVIRSGSNAYCGTCNARVDFGAEECPNCESVF